MILNAWSSCLLNRIEHSFIFSLLIELRYYLTRFCWIGPILIEDYHLIEKLAYFDRERIPECVVHARGASAKGFFEATHNVSHLACADFLRVPRIQTSVIVQFSTVIHEFGSPETLRNPRGFALKFYTREVTILSCVCYPLNVVDCESCLSCVFCWITCYLVFVHAESLILVFLFYLFLTITNLMPHYMLFSYPTKFGLLLYRLILLCPVIYLFIYLFISILPVFLWICVQ